MNKYIVLLSIIVFVFFSANVSQAIMITDLTGIYETAVTEQYSEAQLREVYDSMYVSIMMEASKDSSAEARESWIQALRVLQEQAQTREDNVSKLTVIMLPGYITELTQVPEPSLLLLLGAGLVGLAFRRMSITK